MLLGLWRRLERAVLRFLSSGSLDDPKLFNSVKNMDETVVHKHFGWYGGKVAYIKPSVKLDMPKLMNSLDALADGRKSERGLQFFVGGTFLSSTTRHAGQQYDTPDLIQHDHHLLASALSKTGEFIRHVESRLQHLAKDDINTPKPLVSFCSLLLRDIVCRGLFGLDAVPAYLREALDEFAGLIAEKLSSFNHLMEVKIEGLYYSDLYQYDSQLNAARERFIAARQRFIAEQKHSVTAELQSFAIKKDKSKLTVLARFVLDRVEQFTALQEPTQNIDRVEEALRNLVAERTESILENDFLRTLPVLPLPGDMIVIPVCSALTALANQPLLLAALRKELEDAQYEEKTPEEKRIYIKNNKEQRGLMHCLFLESLRREFQQKTVAQLETETVLTRYASEHIDVFDTAGQVVGHIAPGTLVAILNALPRFNPDMFPYPELFNPERFYPEQDVDRSKEKLVLNTFSYGVRRCPAKEVAEYVFASLIAGIVQYYDIRLSGDNTLVGTAIALSPRAFCLSAGKSTEPAL